VLLATGRYRVVLTRTDDRYVSLAERLALARARDATLLISLHADASSDRDVRGASVYVDSGRAASPRLSHVARVNPHAIARALAATRASEPDSKFLQAKLSDSLDDDIRMTHAPMRADRFYVLASRNTPSVLLEMGFLSNRKDEALLKSHQYQRIIARAIRDALDDYFAEL
jgi:N-acetylmuramoyl-L-alanine amidase